MKKKLKDVCDFYSGTGFPTQYQGEIEGDYPFYKVGDIANNATTGKIYLELCNNYISKDIAKTIKGCILPSGHFSTRRAITSEERAAVLSVCKYHESGLYILFMLYCGLTS